MEKSSTFASRSDRDHWYEEKITTEKALDTVSKGWDLEEKKFWQLQGVEVQSWKMGQENLF